MKKKSLIAFIMLLLISNETFGYKLIINKTFLSHNPGLGNDYNYTNRDVVWGYSPLDPNVVTTKTVNIFCEGNGASSCPNSVVAPSDNTSTTTFMTLEALNAAQQIIDAQVYDYETNGTTTNSNGTICTPDGILYYYKITWTTSDLNEEAKLEFVFYDSAQ